MLDGSFRYNGLMIRLFERWHAISDWLASGLTVCCAAVCWVGASQVWSIGGPIWAIALMAITGTILLGGVFFLARKRNSASGKP